MKVRVCRPEELGETETALWRTFNRRSSSLANPFLRPEFAMAIGRRRSDARVAVLEEPAGDVVGFFPFQRGLAGVGRALGHGLSDYQGVVGAPGLTWHGPELLRGCGLAAWEFTHLVQDQVPLFSPQVSEERPSPIVDLSEGWKAWSQRRAGARMKKIRQYERKLGREEGEPTFALDGGTPERLEQMMAWKSTQYVRTGRRDRFRERWFVEAVQELASIRGNGFAAPLSVMTVADRVVGLYLSLRADGVLAGWFPTYDTELSRYSPGMVQLLHIVRQAAEDGVHSFDLGVGEAAYKETFRDADNIVVAGAVRRATAGAAASWLRTEPVRAATSFVLARPLLRRAARRSLSGLGRVRARS